MILNLQILAATSLVSIFGVGDTGDAHLAVLVAQSAQQLAELNRLLKVANQSQEAMNRAVEMAEKVQAGIDKSLNTFRKAKEFQEAVVRLGKNRNLKEFRQNAEEVRDYVHYYKDLFPEKAKADEERRKDYDSFQDQIQKTSESDLKEIDSLERELKGASPARAQQISAQIQLKQLESQVVTRQQLARLIEENNQLREEAARERRRQAIEDLQSSKMVEQRWKGSWEPKR